MAGWRFGNSHNSLNGMKVLESSQTRGKPAGVIGFAALLMAVAGTRAIAETAQSGAPQTLVLWDTSSPVGDRPKSEDRSSWKAVPNDLLRLEKDPPKASSDPGYYGREYSFAGDAVVETPPLTAVFSSAKGRVTLYSKPDSAGKDKGSEPANWIGSRIVDLSPIGAADGPATISHVEVLRNADDEIVLTVCFSPPGSPEVASLFSFDRTGILEVKPLQQMNRIRLAGPIEYGIVPSFVGDDLIYGAAMRLGTNVLCVPSENLFLGLLPGEGTELVATWPQGKQHLSLRLGEENGRPTIQWVDLDNDGQSFFLAALAAPGIWHKETLKPDYLEKDIGIGWKRPYPARWKTQLYEEDLKTTFVFREFNGGIWRGVAGSYEYPAWFSGEDAFYHFSKKVPPTGESLIYCLEGRDTPLTVSTPADVLKQTLGRQASDSILDVAGRKLRTHHRRGSVGVRRACTCGCTEAIQAVFEAGEEVNRKDDIQGMLDDMIYFVHRHVERINEYQQFADELLKMLQAKSQSSPGLKPFLDNLEEIARQIPQECEVQKENIWIRG